MKISKNSKSHIPLYIRRLLVQSVSMHPESNLVFRQIKGCRKSLALLLQSRAYDIAMIVLIIAYTLLVIFQFGLEDLLFDNCLEID